jgi:hypothetical protein
MKLELNDLIGILAIFDLAASRGTFKGNELAEVGIVFNRVQLAAKAMQEESRINGVYSTPADEELKPE